MIYETRRLEENGRRRKIAAAGSATPLWIYRQLVMRLDCRTINRYGQLVEPTSRVPRTRANESSPDPPLFLRPSERHRRAGRRMARGGGMSERKSRPREGRAAGGGAVGAGGTRRRLSPDVHRTLFFILHYPCSAPLCSIMPAPRINDGPRRRSRTPERDGHHGPCAAFAKHR